MSVVHFRQFCSVTFDFECFIFIAHNARPSPCFVPLTLFANMYTLIWSPKLKICRQAAFARPAILAERIHGWSFLWFALVKHMCVSWFYVCELFAHNSLMGKVICERRMCLLRSHCSANGSKKVRNKWTNGIDSDTIAVDVVALSSAQSFTDK